jgi:hypothetical protein
MKRALFYLAVILMSVLLGLLLNNMEPKKVVKLLTVDTEYAYLMEKDAIGTIFFYLNQPQHKITSKEAISRVILHDQKKASLVELNLYMIEKGHEEIYLNESFTKYLLHFVLPRLSEDWVFEDAYVTIELSDQREYSIRLGRFTFFAKSSEEPYLDWTSLEGQKAKNDLRSRLKTIVITYAGSIKDIESIEIGSNVHLTYETLEKTLTIHIPNDSYVLSYVPVIILYTDGSKDTISHFLFFNDYVMLKESGPMINVYALD